MLACLFSKVTTPRSITGLGSPTTMYGISRGIAGFGFGRDDRHLARKALPASVQTRGLAHEPFVA